jgi:hypothetical protein
MISVAKLTDSTSLIGDAEALRQRYNEDGVLYLRGVMDPKLIGWSQEKYRGVLAAEGLIDPANEAPVWTGKTTKTWRPCDALGTSVWHEIVKQPELNAIMRDIFDAEPVWIPIAAHRSALPTGPLKEGQDIFAGRHQDGFYNEGMLFTICWMPIRDVNMDRGSFAVAPGTHKRGSLHDTKLDNNAIPPGSIPAWAPQPVIGAVEKVQGTDVSIRTEHDELVTVHVTDDTLIRDMNPWPRIPKSELEKIAYPGAHVMAMARKDGTVTVLRRNFY